MITAYRPTRLVVPAFLSMAVSLSLAMPIAATGAGSNPAAQDKEKEKDKDKKAMKKTESGLQYRDIEEGEGEAPAVGQNCVVHYTGWLWENGAKGKKFDSSRDRGKPFSFHVGEREVIQGWDEGVSTMKVKSKRELIIPADLAYGDRGAGGVIPPKATLMFEVELLELGKKWEKTDSGLEYADDTEGTGDEPKTGQTCVMHYTGWLWEDGAKGKKFDSSLDRREPFSFTIGQGEVIKGWDEGVATMKVGGKRRLRIPAKLGYGARGAGNAIPPNATLLFDVELLKVK
jgi:FKBP-type peptidyl-prolyl cis-trans isomerase